MYPSLFALLFCAIFLSISDICAKAAVATKEIPACVTPRDCVPKTCDYPLDPDTYDDQPAKAKLIFDSGNSRFELDAKLRTGEIEYKKNSQWLNSSVPTDRYLVAGTHNLDLNFIYTYGMATCGVPVARVKCNMRNRATWGAPESFVGTSVSEIKDNEAVLGRHSHSLGVNVFFIRELRFDLDFARIFDITTKNSHMLSMGMFPYQLGRGISLGDAYTTAPDFLGYNPANAIQQYAPAFMLAGDIGNSGRIKYDVYVEIADNKASSADNTNARIRGQQFGHKFDQTRGPLIFNSIFASRVKAQIVQQCDAAVTFEPYFMFNKEDEQKIEFLGDSTSRLSTLGAAFDGNFGNCDFSFECAFNRGSQHVYGVDRNIVQAALSNGTDIRNNSKVVAIATVAPDTAGQNALYTTANQAIIDTSPQGASQNGLQIGTSNLRNASDRFSDPYNNLFRGYMLVADFGYYLSNPNLKVALAAGFASGDENPNRDLDELGDHTQDNCKYTGFVGLQERYNGKLVRSAFLMSGAGKIPRILSEPDSESVTSQYPSSVSRFTDLAYFGGAIWGKKVTNSGYAWNVNPNILAFWQTHQSGIFDRSTQSFSQRIFASTYLGIEANVIADLTIAEDCKIFYVLGFFVPGNHYYDIRGVPLNREQQRYYDQVDQSGVASSVVPTLGTSTAFFANVGFEYKF